MARDLGELPVSNGRVVMAGEGQSTIQDISSYYYGLKHLAIYIFFGPKRAQPCRGFSIPVGLSGAFIVIYCAKLIVAQILGMV